jgi:tetratricopeptide (TPR) repeat protein
LIYFNQGKLDEAEDYLLRSLALDKKLENKISIANCYNNLGAIKENQNKYDEAIDFYTKAYAIKLAEESGTAFNQLLTRDRSYVKLAKYIATVKVDITQADLVEDLPFYRGPASQKAEMLTLATAYGYKNNIIIPPQKINELKKALKCSSKGFKGENDMEIA